MYIFFWCSEEHFFYRTGHGHGQGQGQGWGHGWGHGQGWEKRRGQGHGRDGETDRDRAFLRGIRPRGTTFESEYLSEFETEFEKN